MHRGRRIIIAMFAVIVALVVATGGIVIGTRYSHHTVRVTALPSGTPTPSVVLPPQAGDVIDTTSPLPDSPISCLTLISPDRLAAIYRVVTLFGSYPVKAGAASMLPQLAALQSSHLIDNQFYIKTRQSWSLKSIHTGYSLATSVSSCTLGRDDGFLQHLNVTLSSHGVDDFKQPWSATLPFDVSVINLGQVDEVFDIEDPTSTFDLSP